MIVFWSFNTVGNDNCLLVRASIGIYGRFVHWAMVVGADFSVTHYVDGEQTTLPTDQATYCNRSTGSLVLGHDQDSVGGRLDANQVSRKQTIYLVYLFLSFYFRNSLVAVLPRAFDCM